jgi:hypothetical protein
METVLFLPSARQINIKNTTAAAYLQTNSFEAIKKTCSIWLVMAGVRRDGKYNAKSFAKNRFAK